MAVIVSTATDIFLIVLVTRKSCIRVYFSITSKLPKSPSSHTNNFTKLRP